MEKIISHIAQTDDRITPLILRITLAMVLWPHGAQLLLGIYGGYGYTASMAYLTADGLPYIVAFTVIFLQFFGSLFVLLGLYTRLFTAGLLFMFIGMIVTTHWSVGFFMNWNGTLKGEGFEYHLLAIGICLSIILSGSGRLSLDRHFYKNQ